MMDILNKNKIIIKILFFIFLFFLLFIIFLYIIDNLGSNVKKGIFYEAIVNYNIDNDDTINIDDYYVAENSVNGQYCLQPIDLKKTPYKYCYSFERKTIFKTKIINGMWCGVDDFDYFYDSKIYVEKYEVQNIVYLYNLFGLNVDI